MQAAYDEEFRRRDGCRRAETAYGELPHAAEIDANSPDEARHSRPSQRPIDGAARSAKQDVRNVQCHDTRHKDREQERLQNRSKSSRHAIIAQDSRHNLTVKSNETEENQHAAAESSRVDSRYSDGLAFQDIPSTIIRARNRADRCAHIELGEEPWQSARRLQKQRTVKK
jgi:hypothetical protein